MRQINNQASHDLFTQLIARHQSELYGYIFAAVRNWGDADDLFQSVCLVLWSKFDTFQPGSSFFAWARQTAKIKVGDFFRRRHLASYITEDLLDVLSDIDVRDSDEELYLAALQRCRTKLTDTDEELLNLHYAGGLISREIANRLQRSHASVCHSLKRIRRWLFECIQRDIAQHEHVGEKRT
jgi:RNA polymerase sigma-70 factor (ECF subfamily)